MSGEKRNKDGSINTSWVKGPGFPKPEIKGKGGFTPPEPKPLNVSCVPGDYVEIGLMSPLLNLHTPIVGILKEWEPHDSSSSVAIVESNNGDILRVRCS